MRTKVIPIAVLASVLWTGLAYAEEAFKPVIHQFRAYTNAFLTNCYIVETANGVVLVDTPFTVSSSNAMRAQIDAIGKPILGMLITHHHPDHRFGATVVAGSKSVPYYAEAGVDDWIKKTDKPKAEFWRGIYGDEIPKERMLPNKVVADGHSMDIDGVNWTLGVTGQSEGHHDTHWIAKLADGRTYAFIGDTAMPDFHGWLADGHTLPWINDALPKLREKLAKLGVRRVFVGHGNSGTVDVLDWQADYIKAYHKNIRELAADGNLTDTDKAELTKRMIEHAKTENEAGLVGFSSGSVIKELGLF